MKKKNILFVGISGYHYPHTRVRCYNFARELRKYSFQTEVLSYKDHLGSRFSETEMYGIPDRWKLWLNLKALLFLRRYKNQYVYLQKIHYHAGVVYRLARRGYVKLVFDLDDWDESCLCLFNRPVLNQFFFGSNDYTTIVGRTAEMAKFCIVASHSLLENISNYNPHTHLLHTGVDADNFAYYERPDKPEILCGWTGLVWGETVLKSVIMMIEAFARAHDQLDSLKLMIIGGGQLMPQLKEIIRSSFHTYPIIMKEWVHPDQMVDMLHSFDIGLLPLQSSTDNDLTWIKSKSPTKFFEYLATGLPTVASNIGEVSHIVEQNRNGFLVSSLEEFTEKILLLARNHNLRKEMGQSARRTIERQYNLQVLGKKLADLFEKQNHFST